VKKLYPFAFLLLLICCLTSCVDIEESYNFKADGSCSVVYGFDMSHAVSILKNLVSDSLQNSPQFSMVKDTTLNFYNALPDSTQEKLTAEEANMAKTSNLGVKMDLKQSIMKISISHVAKDYADLQYYLDHISKISMDSHLGGVNKSNSAAALKFDTQQIMAGEDYYVYEVSPHKFYRVIDKAKFNAFLKKTSSTLAMAKAMLIDMPYKVVLNFAHPVKKIDNKYAILSADRKHVTLITNMDEVIKDPNIMNLKIEF
jgi:hypothetical protein